MQNYWQKLRGVLLDLLFPPRCVGCHREGAWFCAECAGQIEPIPLPLCIRCGHHLPAGQSCIFCLDLGIDAVRSIGYFAGPLREAIHQLKYGGARVLSEPLGQMLADYAHANQIAADLIMAVPLHPQRLRERGYNQSQLLAEYVAGQFHMPAAPLALKRVRHTRFQVGLDAQERRDNVADAFAAEADRVRGRNVLLIDDVCTTGATLEACSAALKAAGARAVWALTLARTKTLD
jgi:ComF family protein